MNIDKLSENELRAALRKALPVVSDLMKSHEELLAGVGHIVCDIGLLNECRIAGDAFTRKYQ